MSGSQRAGDTPIGVYVVEGKTYFWCTCGKSSKQPFCDGSHKGSDFAPLQYKANQSKKVFSVLVNLLKISLGLVGSEMCIRDRLYYK